MEGKAIPNLVTMMYVLKQPKDPQTRQIHSLLSQIATIMNLLAEQQVPLK